MKQLKMIQGKSPKEPKFTLKTVHPPHLTTQAASSALGQVRSSPSNKSGKVTLNVGKTSSSNSRKKHNEIRIKKGDMAEFLKRKEMRQMKQQEEEYDDEVKSSESSSGRLRDIGCQTVESNLAQKLAESTKLTMLYPTKEDEGDVKKASGDSERHKSPGPIAHTPRRAGDDMLEEKNRSRLNSILDRKEKDPYLPSSNIMINEASNSVLLFIIIFLKFQATRRVYFQNICVNVKKSEKSWMKLVLKRNTQFALLDMSHFPITKERKPFACCGIVKKFITQHLHVLYYVG